MRSAGGAQSLGDGTASANEPAGAAKGCTTGSDTGGAGSAERSCAAGSGSGVHPPMSGT